MLDSRMKKDSRLASKRGKRSPWLRIEGGKQRLLELSRSCLASAAIPFRTGKPSRAGHTLQDPFELGDSQDGVVPLLDITGDQLQPRHRGLLLVVAVVKDVAVRVQGSLERVGK